MGTNSLTNFLDTGLTAGGSYSYEIESVDTSGNTSPRSTPVVVVTTIHNTESASLGNDGGVINAPTFHPSLSADGRYLAFSSRSCNLIDPGNCLEEEDPNWEENEEIFLRDRQTGMVSQITPDIAGGAHIDSRYPMISGDGRYVVFESDRAFQYLGADWDIYLYDSQTGGITLAAGEDATACSQFNA